MKKKYLLWGLAALSFAACSGDDDINVTANDNANSNSEEIVGDRYMAVSLVSNNPTTRADEATYGSGSSSEYSVATYTESDVSADLITFYFFDQNGNGFPVTSDGKSYIKGTNLKNISTETSASVSTTWSTASGSDAVTTNKVIAVLNGLQGNAPSQVVAVVNSDYAPTGNTISLDNLRAVSRTSAFYSVTSGSATTNYFTMSNSVYNDGTNDLYATKIESSNLALTADAAALSPVNIYVERVAAKVSAVKSASPVKLTNTAITFNGATAATDLYVKIDGWNLYNVTTSTPLIKDIDGFSALTTASTTASNVTTTVSLPWTNWNDASKHRCYWSITPSSTELSSTTLSWSGMKKYIPLTSEGDSNPAAYPLENTLPTIVTSTTTGSGDAAVTTKTTTDNHTGIIFAATLTDQNGNAQSIGYWLSNYYKLADLKTAIANFLGNSLYYKDGTAYKSITAEDISFEQKASDYHSSVVVSSSKTWYNSSKTQLTTDGVKTIAATVPDAQVWNEGKCYYFAPITHENSAEAVVRNTWYQISINSITGLGTPVYNADAVVDPVKPTDDTNQWYLDAKIQIQAWKIQANALDLTSR
jgi:hypothetical protein